MKFAVLIQARLGSSRYPQKILKKIDSRSVIEYMIDQILKIFPKNEIIINTTNSKKEILLLNEIKKKKINFFRGSELNVLSRYVNCAKKFNVKSFQYRNIKIGSRKIEFSSNFNSLHSKVYKDFLKGKGIRAKNLKYLIKSLNSF